MRTYSSPLTSRNHQGHGFTLVELLTVIAIMLLLVAMLMPALQNARELSKTTKCMSNLRQISMATFMYAADNNGFAPFPQASIGGESTWTSANQCVQKDGYFTPRSHVESDASYRSRYPAGKWFAEYLPGGALGKMNLIGYCPKGGRFGDIGPVLASGDVNNPYANTSYGINPQLANAHFFLDSEDHGLNDINENIPLAQVYQPAKTCLWIEALENCSWPMNANVTGPHYAKAKGLRQESNPVVGGRTVYQNYGRANVVYVDQHISFKKIPEELPSIAGDPYIMSPELTGEIKFTFWKPNSKQEDPNGK